MVLNTLCTKIFCCLVLLSSVPHFSLALCNPVETNSGPIEGTEFLYGEKIIKAYLGIPYAEPPVGNLRFKKTVPKGPWSNPLQAADFAPSCPQHDDTLLNQNEDCLYLNIWVPTDIKADSKMTVMLWIHGGAFTYGSSSLPVYDGCVLAAQGGVIVVTINYRLGILGFMSAETEEAQGNMGFYDMFEAMKWVKKNIGAFGGDSESITIFGESAGGAAVGVLCLSSMAKGMFKRAILQSGSAARIDFDAKERNARLAQKVAERVDCAVGMNDFEMNPSGVIQCLKTKHAKRLVEVTAHILEGKGRNSFYPVVGEDFLPCDPRFKLIAGDFNDADVMVGHNKDEGSSFLVRTNAVTFGAYGEKNPQVNKTFGANLIRKEFKGFHSTEFVVQHYLGCPEEDDYDAVREQTYSSIGDFRISCPDTYFAESYAKRGQNVFAYFFNHVPSVTPWAPWMGSTHFSDVAFVFGRPMDHPYDYTPAEQSLSRRLIRIWTNFAKTGCPEECWPQFSRARPYYKIFNISNRKNDLESLRENCDFFRPYFGFI